MAIPGLEILMSKLAQLSELIKAIGYECDVIGITDGLPRAQFYLRRPEETDVTKYDTVQLTYIPPEDDSFSHFIINTVTELSIEEQGYSRAQAACDVFNLATTAGFACISGSLDKIIYRAMLYEVAMPVSDETMQFFIETYISGLNTLKQLLQSAS